MDTRHIIMNYTVAPSLEDLEIIGGSVLQSLPEILSCQCEDLDLVVEDMVDEVTQDDLSLEDPFDLVVLYKSGKVVAPGIEKKIADVGDVLVLYRRALLDMWSETGEDLHVLVRQVIVEELCRYFDLPDEDVQDMVEQGC